MWSPSRFRRKPAPLLETERQPWQRALQYGPASSHPAGVVLDLDQWAVRGERARRHAQPPPDFRLQACKSRRGRACAKRILSTLMRRAYRRPVTDADFEAPLKFYQEARADERL